MLGRQTRLAAAGGVAALCLAASSPAGAASRLPSEPTRYVGTLHVTVPRMPSSAHAGHGALRFTIKLRQTSSYLVEGNDVFFSLWSTAVSGPSPRDVRVRWHDPETGKWNRPFHAGNNIWDLGPRLASLTLRPGQVVRVKVRVWFSAKIRPATYLISPGLGAYSVQVPAKKHFIGALHYQWLQYSVKVWG